MGYCVGVWQILYLEAQCKRNSSMVTVLNGPEESQRSLPA